MNRITLHEAHQPPLRLGFTPARHQTQPCPECRGELVPDDDGELQCSGDCPIGYELAPREDLVSYDPVTPDLPSPSPTPPTSGRSAAMPRAVTYQAARVSEERHTLNRVGGAADQFAECLHAVRSAHGETCECAVCEHMATEASEDHFPDPRPEIDAALLDAAEALERVAALLRGYVPGADF